MACSLNSGDYRLLIEHSPVMIWRSCLDASCDYFNDTWLAFTGRTFEEEKGAGWTQGIHSDDRDRCISCYLDHFNRQAEFEMEYRLRRHDNVFRWIFDRGVPFYDAGGGFAGFIGSCVDIDDRRRAEVARDAKVQRRLELAREFEAWILAIVSHDIRNPLSVIRLASHHLRNVAGDPSAVRVDVGRVLRGVDRIDHIVSDLLDFSRQRDGTGIALALSEVDMMTLCRQLLEDAQAVDAKRSIRLEGYGDTAGCWDQHRALQALSNLTSNALQHGDAGSPIRITVLGEGDRVTVAIHNHGFIPSNLLPNIFDPFRSRDGAGRRGQGLGLGLFIAKTIAVAHGGDIEVDSSPVEGTTFRLVLPRRTLVNGR